MLTRLTSSAYARVMLRLAAWHERAGRQDAQLRTCSALARLAGAPPKLRAHGALVGARLLSGQDRHAEAAELLAAAGTPSPEHLAAWRAIAAWARRTGDDVLEQRAWRGAAIAAPTDPDARWAIAKRLYDQGRRADAIAHLEAVVTALPRHHSAQKALAKAYVAVGDKAGEARARAALASMEPANTQNRERLARLLLDLGRPAEAAAALSGAPFPGGDAGPAPAVRPAISICIPFYKGAGTIQRCVSSIFEQTLLRDAAGGVVEVVICSDDSSEEAKAALGALEAAHGVAVHYNTQRLGLTGNWQAALSRGRGEIVTLLHQDDWYAPECLETVLRRFVENPRLAILGMNALLDGAADRPQLAMGDFERPADEVAARPESLEIVFAPSCAFLRRSAIEGLGTLYSADYKWSPERELYYQIARRAPGMLIAFDHRALVCRGLSGDQFSINNEDLRVLDLLTFWSRVREIDPRAEGLGKATFKQALARMVRWEDKSKVIDVQSLLRGWTWLTRIYADERFARLAGSHLPEFQAFLQRHAHKHGPNISALGYEAPARALTVEPAASHARDFVETAMAGGPARIEATRARAERVLSSPAFETPLIVCGFHHSGTRLLGQVLEAIGVFQHVNSRTHEWTYIQELNTLMLPGWMDPEAIERFDVDQAPQVIDKPRLAFRLASDSYTGAAPWGQKDPRNSVTAEAWLRAFPKARIVNIVRDPMDVLGTLPKDYAPFSPGGEVPQQAPAFWAQLWIASLEKTRRAMDRAQYAVEVRFEDLCNQPARVAQDIVDALSLDCSVSPQDFDALNIMPTKVGAYREWLADGRLSEEAAATLRDALAGVAMEWRAAAALERAP